MATEEVELNEALEHAGRPRGRNGPRRIRPFQLGGDRPSHIITPIIHRNRQYVAALFREKLGATPDEVADIPADDGVRAARAPGRVPSRRHGHQRRQNLPSPKREAFASSPRRHGRLTTTLPRVHVR